MICIPIKIANVNKNPTAIPPTPIPLIWI